MVELITECAQAVFNELGGGHSEAVYESAMVVEMGLRDLEGPILRQVACPIEYRGFSVGVGYIDLVVGNSLIIELKAVAKLSVKDELQLRKYLCSTGVETGLLINFAQIVNGMKLFNGRYTTWEGLEVIEISTKDQREIIKDPLDKQEKGKNG